jgi:hypothetical protein
MVRARGRREINATRAASSVCSLAPSLRPAPLYPSKRTSRACLDMFRLCQSRPNAPPSQHFYSITSSALRASSPAVEVDLRASGCWDLSRLSDVVRGHGPSESATSIAASRNSSASVRSSIERANTMPPTHSAAMARARFRAVCPLRCNACSKTSIMTLSTVSNACRTRGSFCKTGKSDQRTASVDILEMLERKIVTDELSRVVDSTRVDADAIAAQQLLLG